MSTLTRRKFLQLSFAPKNTAPRGDVLVYVFLRGAADALNMVVPHGEDEYYRVRPRLGIPRPDDVRVSSPLRTVDLDGFFGLHPALSPLLPIWQEKELAIVHAVGAATDFDHSHFKAQALIERGLASEHGPASGWLGRHLASLDTGNHSPLRGVTISERIAPSLRGSVPVTALRSIAEYHLGKNDRAIPQMQSALATLYRTGDPLDTIAAEAMDTMRTVGALDPNGYRPAHGAQYPDDEFGRGLRQVAMLTKAEVGLEVACLDFGNWDTHIAQGGSEGWMATQMASLAGGLAAFYADVGDLRENLTVAVMSEFGRRVKENGGAGTDHGHGGAIFLLGGHIVGGKIHGEWPGLQREQLAGPGDLAVTTDYRDVLGEIVARRLNNPRVDTVFPEHQPAFIGVTLNND